MRIQRLGPNDWRIFRDIRLAALKAEPEAFIYTYASAKENSDEDWQSMVLDRCAFVGLDNGESVGLAAYVTDRAECCAHRGALINVFVMKSHRGTKLATNLVEAVTEEAARSGVLQLELTVNASNPRALKFYERRGFQQVGIIPRGFRHNGQFSDEVIMLRNLDGA